MHRVEKKLTSGYILEDITQILQILLELKFKRVKPSKNVSEFFKVSYFEFKAN